MGGRGGWANDWQLGGGGGAGGRIFAFVGVVAGIGVATASGGGSYCPSPVADGSTVSKCNPGKFYLYFGLCV
jgi:hypothetical protein